MYYVLFFIFGLYYMNIDGQILSICYLQFEIQYTTFFVYCLVFTLHWLHVAFGYFQADIQNMSFAFLYFAFFVLQLLCVF